MYLEYLPQAKWFPGTGSQVILKSDFEKIEGSILELPGLSSKPPALTYVDAGNLKVTATADSPARVMTTGFPNILHPGAFILGGSTALYRAVTAQVSLALASDLWGTEKSSQWYLIYALAGILTGFSLKAMPIMRVKSQAGQVISLGTLADPATGIGYGFDTDELAAAQLYFLTGSSQGLLRAVTSNNNDNTTGGTITYGGAALSVAQGDWLIVLPAANFRALGTIFNDAAGDIEGFTQCGNAIIWDAAREFDFGAALQTDIKLACPLANRAWVYLDDFTLGAVTDYATDVFICGPASDDQHPCYLGHIGVVNSALTLTRGATSPAYLDFCQFRGSGDFPAYLDQCVLKTTGHEYLPGFWG